MSDKDQAGGGAGGSEPEWTGPLQVLKDAEEIASAYGYLLMRMAVAKDAQDAYDIAKREFQETEETLGRLQDALRAIPMQRPERAASRLPDPAVPSSFGNDKVIWRIELFREADGRFACDYRSGDNTIGGMANYSTTPVGALAELCASFIKGDEDDAVARRTPPDETGSQPSPPEPPGFHSSVPNEGDSGQRQAASRASGVSSEGAQREAETRSGGSSCPSQPLSVPRYRVNPNDGWLERVPKGEEDDTDLVQVCALAGASGVSEAGLREKNDIAVKLAELLAAHRDGMIGSDCSDINDPGSCEKCATLDAVIRALSVPAGSAAAPGRQRTTTNDEDETRADRHGFSELGEDSRPQRGDSSNG